jgi:hypothetical protein
MGSWFSSPLTDEFFTSEYTAVDPRTVGIFYSGTTSNKDGVEPSPEVFCVAECTNIDGNSVHFHYFGTVDTLKKDMTGETSSEALQEFVEFCKVAEANKEVIGVRVYVNKQQPDKERKDDLQKVIQKKLPLLDAGKIVFIYTKKYTKKM